MNDEKITGINEQRPSHPQKQTPANADPLTPEAESMFEHSYSQVVAGSGRPAADVFNDMKRNRRYPFCSRINENNTFVLLHLFRKKTQKTPAHEITKANAERDDWIAHHGKG